MNVWAYLGLTSYYKNYVKAYICIVVSLFELTKCDVSFQWNLDCQKKIWTTKKHIGVYFCLGKPNFNKALILGVVAIFSQKDGRCECVISYANKGLSPIQKRFHPMEGERNAMIWRIMNFQQFLHQNHFNVWTDCKPLEWLA
jgi:hypothetical protein